MHKSRYCVVLILTIDKKNVLCAIQGVSIDPRFNAAQPAGPVSPQPDEAGSGPMLPLQSKARIHPFSIYY